MLTKSHATFCPFTACPLVHHNEIVSTFQFNSYK